MASFKATRSPSPQYTITSVNHWKTSIGPHVTTSEAILGTVSGVVNGNGGGDGRIVWGDSHPHIVPFVPFFFLLVCIVFVAFFLRASVDAKFPLQCPSVTSRDQIRTCVQA